jgi:thermitase
MRKTLAIAAMLLLGVWVSSWALYSPVPLKQDPRVDVGLQGEEYIRGELLVKFRVGTTEEEIAQIVKELHSQKLFTHPNVDFLRLATAPGRSVQDMCRLFQTLPQVEYAEPNYVARVQYVPNDPRYDEQWGPACIGAEQAWDRSRGNHDVIVAIIDTGVDMGHPDLNGNVDRTIDYDFVNNDDDASDDFGHGTHCAGIVAAEINNATGVAGLQQVRIMSVKVASSLGTATMADMIAGINWAVAHGARVLSMSLGSTSSSTGLQQACDNAYAAGAVVVAAAGNNGNSRPTYPAAYESVIGVSALETCTTLASFSSYGTENVELCAPGSHILSTLPTSFLNMFLLWLMGYSTSYDFMDGTSMACPHVSGVAAAYFCYRPRLTNVQVRMHMRRNADDLGTPGYDQYFGYGRVDLFPNND